MAKAKGKSKKVGGKKAGEVKGLEVQGFDLGKRYDVHFHLGRKLAVCRNVRIRGKRSLEDAGRGARPLMQYLELEDAKGRVLMVQYMHVCIVCEAGTKPKYEIVKM